MKRNGRIIALAAVLSLCLVLTGCYIPPDDVSNDSGETSAVNKLPFQTLAPSPTVTVTPDTVTVETPGTINGQPTNTPAPSGDNGWSNWGTTDQPTVTAGPTSIPTGGTIEFNNGNTPEPGAEGTIAVISESPSPTLFPGITPSPEVTATPQSLRLGFKGSDAVRSVQKRLKELGYYSGSVDGDFGPATEKAVKEFQKANGLSADGKVGEKTLKKMNSKDVVTYKQAHATATPKPTATPTKKVTPTPKPKTTATPNLSKDYYLRDGSTGRKVETLQRRLIELGWLDGKVTGTYDTATEEAVRAFQRKTSGLWEDGIAGPDTLRALYSSRAARTSNAAASNDVETLEYGSEGSAVKKMQQKLKDLGYLSGSADGIFGVGTQAAVIAFQKNNNLTADGKAGSATLSKLYSGRANKASGSAVKISDKQKGGRDTTDIASTGYETLQNGSEGTAVRKLQERLKKLGYAVGSVDGKFGDATEAAVMAFQAQNNLTVDGKAGPATQRVLYGTGAKSPVTYSALRMGDTGAAVRNLQYTLYELGYYDGSIDGDYGQTTSDAVRAFQIQNKLTPVDGVAGTVTLSRLYSSQAIAATAPSDLYDTVNPGETGDVVLQVQDCLVEMGFMESTTGVYDEETVAAVKAFQKANGLTADGVCGNETLKILFGY